MADKNSTPRKEKLNISEAADILNECGILPPPRRMIYGTYRMCPLDWLLGEFSSGRLKFKNRDGAQIDHETHARKIFGTHGEVTTRELLNEWLERIDHLKRVPPTDMTMFPLSLLLRVHGCEVGVEACNIALVDLGVLRKVDGGHVMTKYGLLFGKDVAQKKRCTAPRWYGSRFGELAQLLRIEGVKA